MCVKEKPFLLRKWEVPVREQNWTIRPAYFINHNHSESVSYMIVHGKEFKLHKTHTHTRAANISAPVTRKGKNFTAFWQQGQATWAILETSNKSRIRRLVQERRNPHRNHTNARGSISRGFNTNPNLISHIYIYMISLCWQNKITLKKSHQIINTRYFSLLLSVPHECLFGFLQCWEL